MHYKQDSPREPPRLASKFWDEYSGKQRLLQQFFTKTVPTGSPSATATSEVSRNENATSASNSEADPPTSHSHQPPSVLSQDVSLAETDHFPTLTPTPPSSTPPLTQSSQSTASSSTTKRKLTADNLSRASSAKKPKQKKDPETKTGQAKLSSFFVKPKTSATPVSSSLKALSSRIASSRKDSSEAEGEAIEVDVEADHRLATFLSSQESDPPKRTASDSAETKQAWSTLLAPLQAPKCLIHREPTRELTVNKPGPNKGKKFFICSR